MSDQTHLSKDAKTGSNLKARKRLAAAAAAVMARRVGPLQRAERDFARQSKKILTKAVVREVAPRLNREREAYGQSFVKGNGNGAAIRAARARIRASIERVLRASVPKYAQFEDMRERHSRESSSLVTTHLAGAANGLDLQLGTLQRPGGTPAQLFKPPYVRFDVDSLAGPSPSNKSFALPKSGLVGVDLELRHNNSNFLDLDYNPRGTGGEFRSSVGVDFRVPQTGFLFGSAVIENLLNEFVFKLVDNFGFSYGKVHVVHTIFVAIIRTGEITLFDRTMFAEGLISQGSDLFLAISPIQKFTPFTVTFSTKDAFLKGEEIQVMAGAAALTGDYLDDMDDLLRVQTIWKVKSLSIGVTV